MKSKTLSETGRRLFSAFASRFLKSVLLLGIITVIALHPTGRLWGEVIIDGTAAQRSQVGAWLSAGVGTTVTVGADGKITVGPGGNKAAARLREMAKSAVSVTIKIVDNDSNVSVGGWSSSVGGNPKGTTTGTQTVDIDDLKNFGNILNSYGLTPACKLMHEITEVFEGKKGNLSYEDAHKKGVEAEKEIMDEHKTSYVGPRYFHDPAKPGWWYSKIKRPDGSYVVIGVKAYVKGEEIKWYKEKVPCNTASGLIAIPDPDPMVHLFSYDFDLNHTLSGAWDTSHSLPTGAAFDAVGNLYITEGLEAYPSVRVFNPAGDIVMTITGDELITPGGIDVDKTTGDIFVASYYNIVRYNCDGVITGYYCLNDPDFRPSDVAVWRNTPIPGIYGDGSEYKIYVTDRASGQVYVFDVEEDMNAGTYSNVFGKGYLYSPEGISIDSWWSVWVASTASHKVYRFAPNGDLEPFGDRDYFVRDTGRIFYDVGMIDFDGVYVVDGTSGNGALVLYDFDGTPVKTYGEGTLQCPTAVAINFSADLDNLIPTSPGAGETPEIGVNRTGLNYGANTTGVKTSCQDLAINNNGTGILNWSIDDDADWLICNPTSGTGDGSVTVTVDVSGLPAGTYTGSLSITDPIATNSPYTVPVNLTVIAASNDQPPFGSFATPVHGSSVSGSIPVTGWALDDVEVENVKIYNGAGYVGDAVFVEGARPDVMESYPTYPNNYRAGWGYMLLTNFLPGGGNGTYTLYARATDAAGKEVTLGSKTIVCDNANAVKPFGAIDSPSAGGAASGSDFINNGWVLTPQPNHIPMDGSTIHVYVDGVDLGHPAYNNYRPDISGFFPDYANSSGAAGSFSLDTTTYENGVHTIYWTATDSAGNTDGIGSRYFSIRNSSGNRTPKAGSRTQPPTLSGIPVDLYEPVKVIKGYRKDGEPQEIYPGGSGSLSIKSIELERIEIRFPQDPFITERTGYLVVGGQLKSLPIGSTLDVDRGVFYWQPGPGFLGEYRLVFVEKYRDGEKTRKEVNITIAPKF